MPYDQLRLSIVNKLQEFYNTENTICTIYLYYLGYKGHTKAEFSFCFYLKKNDFFYVQEGN